ncbi:MAG TPA: TadA family conjugal transfer-associated ATPase [Alphaproteobacteria bacterium]|nr:TadA family conjugal transfer-associated ATPase [Alphaproteobacteria bacterium]
MPGFGRRTGDAPPISRVVPLRPETPPEPAGKAAAPPRPSSGWVDTVRTQLTPIVHQRLTADDAAKLSRAAIAEKIDAIVAEIIAREGVSVDALDQRSLVTALINDFLASHGVTKSPRPAERAPPPSAPAPARSPIELAKERIQPKLFSRIDARAASMLPRQELASQLAEFVTELLAEEKLQLNALEQRDLVTKLLNDMLGLGPLEPLLADETITDILVNGPRQVYVERGGKLELTAVRFRDDAHVMNIASRIVSRVGRRIDESNPLCDARLPDGSRVNIIIPPLAIDGPSISIRKFSKKKITLDVMARQGNLSPQMATVLRIIGRSRLSVLISGGTGSGKTTLLNALSQMIDPGERIVTIEDAAELQLQQPHVVRLETRPANLEGQGEITMRELVKNALRMRPDRIILGEVRGAEAVDMLQAMNTGHEGSLGTIHANRPREALTRLENMVGLAGINLPSKAVRTQIAAAIDVIIQVSRMRDGVRRITHVMEVVGMEGEVITTQDLFHFELDGEGKDGRLVGRFVSSGLRPHFTPKAAYFGLDKALIEAIG